MLQSLGLYDCFDVIVGEEDAEQRQAGPGRVSPGRIHDSAFLRRNAW